MRLLTGNAEGQYNSLEEFRAMIHEDKWENTDMLAVAAAVGNMDALAHYSNDVLALLGQCNRALRHAAIFPGV
jgi:hypothetical protein